jgi:hypothetical protein
LFTALGLNSFISIVEQLLQDTQERLVYRAHVYISTDIRNYNPGPGDLAYPEKLEMMEVSSNQNSCISNLIFLFN